MCARFAAGSASIFWCWCELRAATKSDLTARTGALQPTLQALDGLRFWQLAGSLPLRSPRESSIPLYGIEHSALRNLTFRSAETGDFFVVGLAAEAHPRLRMISRSLPYALRRVK